MESPALATYLALQPRSPEQQVLRLLLETGVQSANADEGSLLLLCEDGKTLRFVDSVGSSRDTLLGQTLELGTGLTGLAAATGEVQTGAPTKRIAQPGDVNPKVIIAAPMLVDDEVVGVITAVRLDDERPFGARDVDMFARLSTIAALVLQQRRQLDALAGTLSDAQRGPSERRIVESVGRIAAGAPEKLESLSKLLEAVVELAE